MTIFDDKTTIKEVIVKNFITQVSVYTGLGIKIKSDLIKDYSRWSTHTQIQQTQIRIQSLIKINVQHS